MFYVCIELSRMLCTEIEEREINGRMEQCISIPMSINGIEMSKRGNIYLNLNLVERRELGRSNETHYASVIFWDKDMYEKIKELGYEKNLKYVGYAKRGNPKAYINQNKKEIVSKMVDRILEE